MRAVAELAELDALYGQAASATAAGSKSFYFATRFFPAPLARAAHSVYWFCRLTDDLVDECDSIDQGRRDLAAWEDALRTGLRTGHAEHPVLRLFMHTAREFAIPCEYPFELIEGTRMDLNRLRYRNFEELQVFCYRVASVVGLMMCRVIGLIRDAEWDVAREHAIALGIAMQLTNILRDVGEDLEKGRIYLPVEEMEMFGYGEKKLREHLHDQGFRELMRFQIRRARDFYAKGTAGIQMLNPHGRFAVNIASDVYKRILGRIERCDYQVFDKRAVVPRMEKYWLMARNLSFPIARCWAAKLGLWKA